MSFIRKIVYPFSLLYGMITTARNWLYDAGIKKSTRFKIPTIVVGNLSVGGTGKTPQIEYLIRLFKESYKVAVLSRGYKRKSKGFLLAGQDVSVAELGDEPYQFYLKFPSIYVAVDANRVAGIQRLLTFDTPPELVLLDDAFQHRKVVGGFNILLTPYQDLYIDDAVLPTGNLRETVTGAKRAQIIVVTKCPSNLSLEHQNQLAIRLNPELYQTVFFSTILYDEQLQGEKQVPIVDLIHYKIILVTGIANPSPLLVHLSDNNLNYKHLKFPDHHHFTSEDILRINKEVSEETGRKKIIITTEKDYVRLKDKIANLSYISIKIKMLSHQGDFNQIISNYVEQSRGDR